MIAPLLETGRRSLAGSGVHVPPPPHFRALQGRPKFLRLEANPWAKSRGDTVARMNGLRYEGKVQNKLQRTFGDYLQSPAIYFEDQSGLRFVVPDGLIIRPNRVYVIEIKSQHMPEAWWQLHELYLPILRSRNAARPISCLEIVKSYDPSMPFPCSVDMVKSDEIAAYKGSFGVVEWKL